MNQEIVSMTELFQKCMSFCIGRSWHDDTRVESNQTQNEKKTGLGYQRKQGKTEVEAHHEFIMV